MAVHVLPRASARSADRVAVVPPLVLALTVAPAVLDLMRVVQPGVAPALAVPSVAATGVAAAVLLLTWARFPRTAWLLAAGFAALAGMVLRVAGADVGPVLSLLAIIALGVGGAFGAPATPRTARG
jgi:hypothetical protein